MTWIRTPDLAFAGMPSYRKAFLCFCSGNSITMAKYFAVLLSCLLLVSLSAAMKLAIAVASNRDTCATGVLDNFLVVEDGTCFVVSNFTTFKLADITDSKRVREKVSLLSQFQLQFCPQQKLFAFPFYLVSSISLEVHPILMFLL